MRILVLCVDGPERGWNEFVDVDLDGDENDRLLFFHHRARHDSVYEITEEEVDSSLGRARVARPRPD